MWEIVFPRTLFNDIRSFLFRTSPSENGCFLLANHFRINSKRDVLLVTKAIFPSPDSWNYSSGDSLEPKSSYINQAVVAADFDKSSLIFIHTHPSPYHPVTFSAIDESSNKRIFENLSQILPNTPLGSLVLSRKELYGVVYTKGSLRLINRVRLSGNILQEFSVPCKIKIKNNSIDPMFDRQVRMFGENNQKKLEDLVITIVGVGGTGSSIAVQLARMGVKKLRMIDFDILDESNISRVYGATIKDIGKSKVIVVRDHLKRFSKASIEILPNDITKKNVLKNLIDSDVIFSCTDNLTSRSILNDVSLQYYIPLIDVGCRIHLDDEGSIDQAVAKVQVVSPDSACLWCTGTLDGRIILEESYPEEERTRLAAEGYCECIEKQPSIISMTTLVASLAVNKFLSILGVFGEDYDTLSQIEVKNGFMISNSSEIKSGCICQKRRGIADKRKIFNFD